MLKKPEKKDITFKYHHLCFGGSSSCRMLDEWSDKATIQCKHAKRSSWGVPSCKHCDGKHTEINKIPTEYDEKYNIRFNQACDIWERYHNQEIAKKDTQIKQLREKAKILLDSARKVNSTEEYVFISIVALRNLEQVLEVTGGVNE